MFYFLLGFIFGCITGLISKKGIHIEITKEVKDNERPK